MSKRWSGRVAAVVLGALVVGSSTLGMAQDTAKDKPADKKKVAAASADFDPSPRYEIGIFGGASFWQLISSNNPVPNKLVNGGLLGARFTWDFHRYIGLEADYTYGFNNLRFTLQPQPAGNTPVYPTTYAFGGRNQQVFLGPVFNFTPRTSRFRPFVLAGPAYQKFSPTSDARFDGQAIGKEYLNAANLESRYGPALIYGGGVKFNFAEKWSARLDVRGVWTENPHFNLSGVSTGPGSIWLPKGGTQNGLQASLGLNYRFGRPVPPPVAPATKVCPGGQTVGINEPCPDLAMSVSARASQTSVCPGVKVHITPTTDLPAGHPSTYAWTVKGESKGAGDTFDFDTTGLSGGSYEVGVTQTAAGYKTATGATTVNVQEYRPPTGSASASPAEIYVGEKSTLSSSFTGQCGGAIGAAKYTASEGSIDGNTFDSTGVQFEACSPTEQRKTITITASASDEKSMAGTATTTIIVKKKACIVAKRLPDVVFANNNARVNNCGKRVLLEELKKSLDADPTGKVVLVGHIAKGEKLKDLDAKRALNAAAVVSAGTGICLNFPASQILVAEVGDADNGVATQPFFCGTSADTKVAERSGQAVKSTDANAQYRRVEVYFVPTGGLMPDSVKDAKDAATLGVGKLGCPK